MESCLVKTIGQVVRFEKDGPRLPGEVLAPVRESTPIASGEEVIGMERRDPRLPPMVAQKKKMWAMASPRVNEAEDGEESEKDSSGRVGGVCSPASFVSSGRKKKDDDEARKAKKNLKGGNRMSTVV